MTMAEGELAIAEVAFVRRTPVEALPPPLAMRGAWGWLRSNLLSSPFNIALTAVTLALIVWVASALIDFLIIDAVWSGSDRTACMDSEQHRKVGACWPFVWERLNYFIYGSYPIPQRWRVDVFFTMLAIGVVWMLWLAAPDKGPATRFRVGGPCRRPRTCRHSPWRSAFCASTSRR